MKSLVPCLAIAFASTAGAQHHGHGGHSHHGSGHHGGAAAHGSAQPGGSPYAGQQHRAIKALSDEEVKGLLAGAGMGYAKAAELNRYPGPMHALEHAEALELSAAQRHALAALLQAHKAEARQLGARVVELERELDALFAGGRADEASVDAALARIAEAQARLRGSHLKTHLATTRLLTPAQVERYVAVRGYAGHRPAKNGV